MKKIKDVQITNKLPVWMAVWAVIILAGLILFFALGGVNGGFKADASIAQEKIATISHDKYLTISEDLSEELADVCKDGFKQVSLQPNDYAISTTTYGGKIEFFFSEEVADEDLYAAWTYIESALQTNEDLGVGDYSFAIHTNTPIASYTYVWRAALSAAAMLAVAFLYVAIRYNLSFGFSTFICGLANGLVTLGLVIILRIPVTSALATCAVFAGLYSILLSLLSFNVLRDEMKKEEYKALSIEEGMEQAKWAMGKPTVLVSGIALVFFILLAIFGGAAVRTFAIPAILAVLAGSYGATVVSPSLVTAFRKKGKEMADKRIAKQQQAKLEEEQRKRARRNKKSSIEDDDLLDE